MHYYYILADYQGTSDPVRVVKGSYHSIAHTFYIGTGANYNINSKFFVNANSRIEVLRNKLAAANTLMDSTPSVIPVAQLGIGLKF